MDHKARYQALVEFLLPYQEIWRNEIMLQYPRPVRAYPAAWLQELRAFITPEKAHQLSQGIGWEKLKAPGLAAFSAQLEELTQFPAMPVLPPMPVHPQTWVRIIPKKQHEIERLAPLIASHMTNLTSIVDVGGGQGHLAQSVAHHYGLKVLSLDMDQQLQRSGAEWQTHKWSESKHTVRFHAHKLMRNDEVFAKMLDHQTLTTGLHTCGPLALAHLEAALMADAPAINLPCCYHKLDPKDTRCSGLAQWHPLPLNQFALTLASGAHRKASLEDVRFRTQVKRFRYALHFLLEDEFQRPGHVSLGNCPPQLYDGRFAAYAREQLARLHITTGWSDERFNTYYADKKVQSLIDDMLAATIIRDAFGRAIEAAVICDRAVWLEEEGREVDIIEVFDPHISPRSLAMVARAMS